MEELNIVFKEKRVLGEYEGNKELERCVVLFSCNDISMHQYCALNKELPHDILLQMCKVWAKHIISRDSL